MKITLIAACASRSGVIGKDGGIPWELPSDLKFFKEYTKNKICVMGRATFQSLPVFLVDRVSVVLTSNINLVEKRVDELKSNGLTPNPILIMEDVDELFNSLEEIVRQYGIKKDEIVIIGGESIYKEFLPYSDKIILSLVDCNVEGDRSFPAINKMIWEESELLRDVHEGGDEYSYSRMTLNSKPSNVYHFPDGKLMTKREVCKHKLESNK